MRDWNEEKLGPLDTEAIQAKNDEIASAAPAPPAMT
jgi:hypothetical protein